MDLKTPRSSHFKKGNCLYIIGYDDMPNMYKIGKTKNINTRISSYITCNPHKPNVLHLRYVKNMTLVENILKVTLKTYNYIGNGGGKEWYMCSNLDILKNEINSVINFISERTDRHITTHLDLPITDEDEMDTLIETGQIKLCTECNMFTEANNIINDKCTKCI